MQIYWLYIIPLTGPIFFWRWYEWKYRWAIFDGCKNGFWRRLRTDIWISLPGKRGHIARITRVRTWVRKYASAEGPSSFIHVPGVDERFKTILRNKRYHEYEQAFLPPRWSLWAMMSLSLVWPIVLITGIILFLARVLFIFVTR